MVKLTLVSISDSRQQNKKYNALFSDGKVIHFGQKNAENYTIHKNDTRKELYLLRHKKNENWNNPQSADALSRWILWNKKTLRESIADFKKKFDL
jgi:L-rhamnose mutarotase